MSEGGTTLVIFGASGDLSRKMLFPSLFRLFQSSKLRPPFRILGFSRPDLGDDGFRDQVKKGLLEAQPSEDTLDESGWEKFAKCLNYLGGDLENGDDFARLKNRTRELEAKENCDRLFYLAIPPHLYQTTLVNLGEARMTHENGSGYRRVVIEKPFGWDLDSARSLNETVHSVLSEGQVFRIDHFLGKETTQNILFLRFANTVFEPVWNRHFVDHVEVSALESIDVGSRGSFYDQTGVLRDMFQNHLLQLLTLAAMEPPGSFEGDSVRNEKVKVLAALRGPSGVDRVAADTRRGQYRGYREVDGVSRDSSTATYAAVKLAIDNWRWQGVPFYLRSGKALEKELSEVVVEFRRPPRVTFPFPEGDELRPNHLTIGISPEEGIHLRFEAKVPGKKAELRSVDMTFRYSDTGGGDRPMPTAYERLFLAAMEGDPSLFARSDGIELAWKVIDPILDVWNVRKDEESPPLEIYEKGSSGPPSADELLARDGRRWSHGRGGEEG